MNDISHNKCMFCRTPLQGTMGANFKWCLLCDYNYKISLDKNNLIRNQFILSKCLIQNFFSSQLTYIDNYTPGPFIKLELINWDYSSIQKIEDKLKLILSFH